MYRNTAVALLAALLVPAAALAGGRGHRGGAMKGDEEIQSLHRQLVAARVVHTLNLTADQKKSLSALAGEARALRDAAENSPEVAAAKAEMKKVLARAVTEARASGKPSPETRVQMETIHDRMRAVRKANRGRMKEIGKAVHELLTDEQKEALQELRHEAGHGRRHGERGGKGRALRLLLSDEMAAELAR